MESLKQKFNLNEQIIGFNFEKALQLVTDAPGYDNVYVDMSSHHADVIKDILALGNKIKCVRIENDSDPRFIKFESQPDVNDERWNGYLGIPSRIVNLKVM